MPRFPNMAGNKEAQSVVEKELTDAGVELIDLKFIPSNTEVPTTLMGGVKDTGWVFERAWYYYRAHGPGIAVEDAEKLHEKFGQEVRVDGHCGCPSPREWFKGFACGSYHIDSSEGLKALVGLIKEIRDRNAITAPVPDVSVQLPDKAVPLGNP